MSDTVIEYGSQHPRQLSRPLQRSLALFACVLALAGCTRDEQVQLQAPSSDAVVQEGSQLASGFAATAPERAMLDSRDQMPAVSQVSRVRARTQAQAQRAETYFIEFRARSAASYGHTFAAIGKLNPGGAIESSEIVGLHPATESPIPWMIGHVFPVPSETGASDGDTEEIYLIARYRITMDRARYDELMGFVRRLQANSPAWHAVFYNCNNFVGDIARHMGLDVPANTLLMPKDYIDELRRLNRD